MSSFEPRFRVSGYKSVPHKWTTTKLIEAFTDLAVDSPVAYGDLCQDDKTEMLLHRSVAAPATLISCWCHNLNNLKLAYLLGYIDLIRWGGADWINDCCDQFREDRAVAFWFRRTASVYLRLSDVQLPKMGELWGCKDVNFRVASVQANRTDSQYYSKEMLVVFGDSTLPLLKFIKQYKFVSTI